MQLKVMFVTFVKSSGTRYQNHKYRTIKALIINCIPISMLMKSYLAAASEVGINTRH